MEKENFEQLATAGAPNASPAAIRLAKTAEEFEDTNIPFLWQPYFPIGTYSVMMAAGGIGKTSLCCKIAAAVSKGEPLPGDTTIAPREPGDVLIISAEDVGGLLKKRLLASGADAKKVRIFDCEESAEWNLDDGYEAFHNMVKSHKPRLLIIDPWHAFLGPSLNVNKITALRPVLRKISSLAQECQCSIILISHVNKREQGENVNNAAIGSVDLINASRSALMIAYDEDDEDCRIMVHTKSNYAPYGPSVKFRFTDDGVEWAGFSDVTRQTIEAAARQRSTSAELLRKSRQQYDNNPIVITIKALLDQSCEARWSGTMSELMAAGATITHHSLADTPRKLTAKVKRLKNQLLTDGICHDYESHGTGGGKHSFWYIQSLQEDTPDDSALLSCLPF